MRGIDSRAYQVAAWVGVALQAAALISVLLLERWQGAINLTAFLLGSIAFLSIHDRLPSLLDLLIVAAALANAAGWAGNLFARISFYDSLVHAFTAFAVIAALAYMAWTPARAEGPVLTLSRFLKATAGGLILGVLWEVGEVTLVDPDWADTLFDLLMDTIGAAFAAPFAIWAARQVNRKSA